MKILKDYWLIILLLILGIWVRVAVTSGGNFIFHMDNARDMVDIREMVVLHKWRLIGPTSGIEGVFTGPLWYYISAVPFLLSGGNPYASILLQIFFWTVGCFFLLQIVKRWGIGVVGAIGGVWIASNLIILNSQHSLSPNPIILLIPMFIYLLEKYLVTGKQWLNILCWVMAGVFFQLEMAFGIFMPLVMIVTTSWIRGIGGKRGIGEIGMGLLIFALTLLPQIFFDFRHQFLMTKSLFNYLIHSGSSGSVDMITKISGVLNLYWGIYKGLLMNLDILIWGGFAVLLFTLFTILRKGDLLKEKVIFVSLIVFFVPLLGYLVLPIKVMPWHAQAGAGALLILLGYGLGKLGQSGRLGLLGGLGITLIVTYFSVSNLEVSYFRNIGNLNNNRSPSLFRNEISVIDYVYQKADSKNFKAYVYMPSIIDYPYQYLFWWYGLKKYGYLPSDYAYLPNVPAYISNKSTFSNREALKKSDKLFLIKEPDTRDERHLWENSFRGLPSVSTVKLGSIEIEEKIEIGR